MLYTKQLAAVFGPSYSGQAANVTYNVYNGGTLVRGPITGTLTEVKDSAGNTTTGAYKGSDANFDNSWLGTIEYSIVGQAGLVAIVELGNDLAPSPTLISISPSGTASRVAATKTDIHTVTP